MASTPKASLVLLLLHLLTPISAIEPLAPDSLTPTSPPQTSHLLSLMRNTTLPAPTPPNLGPLTTTFTAPSSCSSIASQWLNLPATMTPTGVIPTSIPMYGGLPDCYPAGFYAATYGHSLMPYLTLTTATPTPSSNQTISPPILPKRADERPHDRPSPTTSAPAQNPYYSPGLFCPHSYTAASRNTLNNAQTQIQCCPSRYSLIARTLCRHKVPAATLGVATHSFDGNMWRSVTATPTPTGGVANQDIERGWDDTYITAYALAVEIRHFRKEFEANGQVAPKERAGLGKGQAIGLAVGLVIGILAAIGVGAASARWLRDRKTKKMVRGFKEKSREGVA
ncbi:MAG: hypothetical protein M1814_005316 [Vezdaea aestivalis]|nr:MAG: hypothetical protein M1814_005316 [Vezdaea aestivalis]